MIRLTEKHTVPRHLRSVGTPMMVFFWSPRQLEKAGSSAPDKLRDGIEQATKLVSVSGVFNMSPKDHNGLDLSAFEIVRVTKGDWQLVK